MPEAAAIARATALGHQLASAARAASSASAVARALSEPAAGAPLTAP